MEPLEVVHVMDSGEDPECGSMSYLSQNHDLGPATSDSDQDGLIYSGIRKLRLEKDDEGGKDFSEGEEDVDKTSEESGGDSYGQNWWDFADEHEKLGGFDGIGGWGEVEKEDESSDSSHHYPLRPDAEDCVFYLKTGSCKFGAICKFNHPVRRTFQYYSKIGSCKLGRSCKYNHIRPKGSGNSVVELNTAGLPARPDEQECRYYIRTGSCKYGAICKFNHPEPLGSDRSTLLGSENDGSQSSHGSSESANTSWSSSRTVIKTFPFEPMAPLYPSERRMLQPTGYVVNNPWATTHLRWQQHKWMAIEEFPERPGQPVCNYFARTGDCKFKYTCKYHHPKNLSRKSSRCIYNNDGLPLRPNRSVCVYYRLYGICKFGPVCKFDHPIRFASLMGPGY